MAKLARVISGFQTGADQAAIRAAVRLGIPTGGWMPKGWLTEAGPRPEFKEEFGAREHHSQAYPPRTHQNAADADMTLWFGRTGSPGYWCTYKGCQKANKAFRAFEEPFPAGMVFYFADQIKARFLDVEGFCLNCAGPRESTQPGIGERAEVYMVELFQELLKG